MNDVVETVENILSNYSAEESLIQKQLQTIQLQRLELFRGHPMWIPLKFETREDVTETMKNALRRNKALKRKHFRERSRMSAQQLDYSFRGITYMSDIRDTRPRNGLKRYKRSSSGRFWCGSFRLNNNNIVTVQGISDMVQQIFEIPENLTWLDLSFNKLTYLHSEISELKNLKILYLHGNLFSQFTPVLHHLQALSKLYSLTLHGNPIEEVRGYRQRVLSVLPNLKNLDFTNVTNADFENLDYVQNAKNGR